MRVLFIIGLLSLNLAVGGQERQRISLKDSLDGKFDVSDYVMHANGFIPVPYIITEPALGGFGMAIAPIWIKKRPPYIDSVDGRQQVTPVAPDITGGATAYTLNNTWLLIGFKAGTLVKSRIKYRIGGGYTNINMNFYRTFNGIGEKKLEFNIRMVPIILQAIKRIRFSHWYAGLKYLFLDSKLRFTGSDSLADLGKPLETHKLTSELGAIVEMDNRDNIFTPDKGIFFHVDALRSDNIFGSDYDFWRINYFGLFFLPLGQKWVGGLRVDGAQSFGDVPFYLQPYINMRGIPAERYQGKASILTEAELRWDFVRRWSIVGFTGAGKAFDDWSDFGSTDLVVSWGAGFRYLVARKFKLRMGIDLAHGPGSFAYYIIFGSYWLR